MNGAILEGIRVLDLTRVMSGPFCTSMLADLGAEVIKLELPGRGDESRAFGPYREGESTYFMLLNRNKKSVTVNLKSPDGQELVRSLIPKCDVLVENFRPGVLARMGLDYEQARKLNDRIIYASISGFGQDGPLKDLPAFDLVIQAMSGLMSLTGPKGGPATAVGESVADVSAGMFAAWGIVAALFARERTGQGRHVDIAMLDSILAMQLTGLSRQLYSGDTPKPVGNRHPVTYPVDSFPTRDGDIVLVCFSDELFRRLAQLIGRAEMAEDPRFDTNAARNANEEMVREAITAWTRELSAENAVERLLAAGIPAAPVRDLGEVMRSPHVAARNLVVNGRHGRFGDVPLVPQPVKFSGTGKADSYGTPMLGEHTEAVLSEVLGLGKEVITDLRHKKVI